MNLFPIRLLPAVLLLAVLPARADLEAGLDAVARRDFVTALKEFKPLAEQGDVAAQVNLGNCYMEGLGVKQNYVEAQRWYLNAAERNERMAQTKLGILYYYGLGVTKDATEAARWFRKAAEQGEAGAQAILGSLYAAGDGLPADSAMAYYWYSLAAEQGSDDGVKGRDSLEEELTPGQRDEALRLLGEARRRKVEAEEQAFEAATATIPPAGQNAGLKDAVASRPAAGASHPSGHKAPHGKRHKKAKKAGVGVPAE